MNESLFKEIANLLATLPNLHNENGRREFMLHAGLDEALIKQIDATRK